MNTDRHGEYWVATVIQPHLFLKSGDKLSPSRTANAGRVQLVPARATVS